MKKHRKLRAGELVRVRSKEEILATLDKTGKLDGLPFMPEMFAFCGKRFSVYKRAHKTCDTVTGDYKGRKLKSAVHLEGLRCDGQSHGGCQARCLIFWKEAWLLRVAANDESTSSDAGVKGPPLPRNGPQNKSCTETDVIAATGASNCGDVRDPVYACQATLLPSATEFLHWASLLQYVEDFTSGNVSLGRMFQGFFYMGYNGLANAGLGFGRILRWLYDASAPLRAGLPYPRKRGCVPTGVRTPDAKLDLQPGDWVRVKSYEQILATLDYWNKNRGLYFDAEMVPYCGGKFRVLARVTKIVDEKTGRIQEFKTPAIMLEGTVCQSRYSECRLFCPRSIYSYWREIWLEKLAAETASIGIRK